MYRFGRRGATREVGLSLKCRFYSIKGFKSCDEGVLLRLLQRVLHDT